MPRTSKEYELAKAKLASSGLSVQQDAKKHGIKILTAAQTQALSSERKAYGFPAVPSLQLNYYDLHGRPLESRPKWGQFYRIRALEQPAEPGSITETLGVSPKHQIRYLQPPRTLPVAYYPCRDDWPAIAEDPTQPIIMTEGELKALCINKYIMPAIGLGGVWNFRALKDGVIWLPSLDLINWRRRVVYVSFDSDIYANEHIVKALNELANQLERVGAIPYIVFLPRSHEKMGADDFIVQHGPEAYQQLVEVAEPWGQARNLWRLNQDYLVILNPGLVYHAPTRTKMNADMFTRLGAESKEQYVESQLLADGSMSRKLVAAAPKWLKWPQRREAARFIYQPGGEPEPIHDGRLVYNIWPGWGVIPKKGSVKPFTQLIDHLFTDAEPSAKQWFLDWLAYPLQYPGTKLTTAVVVRGAHEGTGKSLIGYTMARIYGQNFVEIDETHLGSTYTDWAEGKQFVMGDDVTSHDARKNHYVIKNMITRKRFTVNAKYVPCYETEDRCNFYFTTNEPDAFYLGRSDRRFFIHEVVVGPLPDKFYVEYMQWLDAGGAAHLFQWLLGRDLSGFNPMAAAPMTQAKERMRQAVQSELGAWVHDLTTDPTNMLQGTMLEGRDLVASEELLMVYDPMGQSQVKSQGIGRELAKVGIRQVCGGVKILGPSGKWTRYFILRNEERWLRASTKQVKAHVDRNKNEKKY